MVDHIVSVDDNFNFPAPVFDNLKKKIIDQAYADGMAVGMTMRVDNTVGERVFIGNGSTEKMIYGDTGTRLVETIYAPGVTTVVADERPRLSREGNTVTLNFTGRSADSNWVSGAVFATLPVGFRPTTTIYLENGYAGAVFPMTVSSVGEIKCHANGAVSGRWNWSWKTKDPWPTVLPGIAG